MIKKKNQYIIYLVYDFVSIYFSSMFAFFSLFYNKFFVFGNININGQLEFNLRFSFVRYV